MKLLPALAITALLGASTAFAQSSTANSQGNGQATPPTNSTAPSGSASNDSSAASSAKALSVSCHKQAKEKNLTGADRKQFIKDCKAGKTTG
jgi:hypothetical protein